MLAHLALCALLSKEVVHHPACCLIQQLPAALLRNTLQDKATAAPAAAKIEHNIVDVAS
jgi:hypothetical protein